MDFGDLLGKVDVAKVGHVVDWVGKNEDLLTQVGRLPEYLSKVADGLDNAGGQAKTAAVALIGDDGESGVRAALADASVALKTIVGSVGAGAEKIADAAAGAAKVPLMDGPASRLAAAATELETTTEKLGQLSEAMEVIGQALAQVAGALGKLGDHLVESSGSAREFLELK
jgi:methyl-accepting chemotaxis protein